jgi:hypothetical protein
LLSVKATHAERLTPRRRAARSTRAVAEMMWRRSGTEVNFPIAVALLAGAQGGFLQWRGQDRAAAAVFLSVRRAIAWGDRTSRRCRASTAACWSSGLIMPLGLPSLS